MKTNFTFLSKNGGLGILTILGLSFANSSFGQCPVDQTINTASYLGACQADTTIELASSELGVFYYLRDDFDNSIISGPLAGTGGALTFNTGLVNSATSFNIYAEGDRTAVNFDGTDDIIHMPHIGAYAISTFTVEAWVRTTQSAAYSRVVTAPNGGNQKFSLNVNNGVASFLSFGSSGILLNGTIPVNDGQWHHIAGVFDNAGNEVRLFVDGVADGTLATSQNPIGATEGIFIGDYSFGTSNPFEGDIDEVRVWNTAKTGVEINATMNSCLTGAEAGLVLYVPFSDGQGSSVADLSPNANGGTLINMDPATDWIMGRDICTCPLEMNDIVDITLGPIAEQTILQADFTKCSTSDTIVTLNGTQTNVHYYLRDDADNTIVDGPFQGSGSTLELNAPVVSTTTTFNVYAEVSNPTLGVDFDGIDDRAGFTRFSCGVVGHSLEGWINTTSVASGSTYAGNSALSILGDSDNNVGMGFGIDAGVLQYHHFNGSWNVLNGASVINDGEWHHVAVVHTAGGTVTLYVDGVADATALITLTGNPTYTSIDNIGTSYDPVFTHQNFFEGQLDEVRVWNDARTPTEIADNYKGCLSGGETNLLRYFKMEDGTGSPIVSDLTGTEDALMSNMDPSTDWVDGVNCVECDLEMADQLTITIGDVTNPTASNPASVNVECLGDVPAVDINVVTDEADNCTANPLVAFVSDVSDANSCPETITRTYSVTDDAANSILVTQLIIVEDITTPTATNPVAINVECSADVPAPDVLVVTDEADNCSSAPAVAFVSDVSDGNSNPEVITRTYSVMDDCGNMVIVEQTITVNDVTDPVITNCPTDITQSADAAGCTAIVTWADPISTDNCATPTLTSTFNSGDSFSAAITEVIYTSTDDAGNQATCSFYVTVTTDLAATSVVTNEIVGFDGSIDLTVTGGTAPYTFDWDNDGTGDNDDTEDLTSLDAGTFGVMVTDALGCTVFETIMVDSELAAATSSKDLISVYPNPSNGTFTVDFGTTIENAKVELVDLTGKVVYSEMISGNKFTVSQNELATGNYLLKVYSETGFTVTQIIKY